MNFNEFVNASLGGVIVESGRFDWKASGRYAPIAAPNPSYHGVSFAEAAGSAALTTYIRAILLRDTGAALSPFNVFVRREKSLPDIMIWRPQTVSFSANGIMNRIN